MSVKTYSKKTQGSIQLSNNFKVSEFACRDGSDCVLIDELLPAYLQGIRNYFGKAVTVNSGYRTAAYNTKVGGAKKSNHVKGMAADIAIYRITPAEVAKVVETMGLKGVGKYNTFTHVDTRTSKAFWLSEKEIPTSSLGCYSPPSGNVRQGDNGSSIKWLQINLKAHGFDCGMMDGAFGPNTCTMVKSFQKARRLTADGIVGKITRAALLDYLALIIRR